MEYFDILLFQIKQVNNAIPSITVSDLIFIMQISKIPCFRFLKMHNCC